MPNFTYQFELRKNSIKGMFFIAVFCFVLEGEALKIHGKLVTLPPVVGKATGKSWEEEEKRVGSGEGA